MNERSQSQNEAARTSLLGLAVGDAFGNALMNFAVDRDTVGAIVGGIVACATGVDGIPVLWREATEKLPL